MTKEADAAREIAWRLEADDVRGNINKMAAVIRVAQEAARAEERAAVVAWLRSRIGKSYIGLPAEREAVEAWGTMIADEIERGRHVAPPRDHLAKGSD